jgi:hypothetical protein
MTRIRQKTLFDPGQALAKEYRDHLRAMIFDKFAQMCWELVLPDECRCPECGGKLRCIAWPEFALWCDEPCGFFRLRDWLKEERVEKI